MNSDSHLYLMPHPPNSNKRFRNQLSRPSFLESGGPWRNGSVCMLLSWVSRGQIYTTARRDTKYIILQSLEVELAAVVFGPGNRPDGNNRSPECVWVHRSVFAGPMRGRQLQCRSRDTTPHSSSVHRLTSLCWDWELYLCAMLGGGWEHNRLFVG